MSGLGVCIRGSQFTRLHSHLGVVLQREAYASNFVGPRLDELVQQVTGALDVTNGDLHQIAHNKTFLLLSVLNAAAILLLPMNREIRRQHVGLGDILIPQCL